MTIRWIAVFVTSVLLAACGTDSASDLQADQTAGSVNPGTFKLYEQSKAVGNPNCYIYTELQLINGFAGPLMILESKLSGSCKIAVRPNRKVLNLVEGTDHCGSKQYKTSEDSVESIEILDHRGRLCKDLVPASLIVTIHSDEDIRTLYGQMKKDTIVGSFTQIAGIGGESTGFGLVLKDGTLVEVDLATNGLNSSFVEEGDVEIEGYFATFHGVETVRQVLVAVAVNAR